MKGRIEELRAVIDALDDTIAGAIARRREVVAALYEEKARRGVAFVDPGREAVIEARYCAALPDEVGLEARGVARAVLEVCRPKGGKG